MDPHRTAIRRICLSRPVARALADGIITQNTTVLDYGCGRGEDVERLRARDIWASGWDPHFTRGEEPQAADVVNLGYVLNVIESTFERANVLKRAFDLCRKALVIAVRVEPSRSAVPGHSQRRLVDGIPRF